MTSGSLPSLSLTGLGRVGHLLRTLQIDISDGKADGTWPKYNGGKQFEQRLTEEPYFKVRADENENMGPPEVKKFSKRKSHPVRLLNHQKDAAKIWTWSTSKEMKLKMERPAV